jgi:hypothetical protein
MGACDFPSTFMWGGREEADVPVRIPAAVSAEQRARFEEPALLAAHGNAEVEFGLSGRLQSLASFVATMRSDASGGGGNASFALSSGGGSIGASEPIAGAPRSLAAGAGATRRTVDEDDAVPTERVFTVGGDGAGLEPHVNGATYQALLHGHMLWIVAPPQAMLPADLLELRGYELIFALNALRLEPYHESKASLLTCTQTPGTAVYLPAGWARAAVAFGETVSLGVQETGWGAEWAAKAMAEEEAEEERARAQEECTAAAAAEAAEAAEAATQHTDSPVCMEPTAEEEEEAELEAEEARLDERTAAKPGTRERANPHIPVLLPGDEWTEEDLRQL